MYNIIFVFCILYYEHICIIMAYLLSICNMCNINYRWRMYYNNYLQLSSNFRI